MVEEQMNSGAGSLQISGVTKSFGDTIALDRIDLEVKSGEFVSLLGPSGCGKTTLLRCVAGLITANAGDIGIDGKSIMPVSPWNRDVSVVFQSYALFPHMSVEGNIAFGLKMKRFDKSEIRSRISEVLELVRMAEFRDRMPAQLSGGQQQRVALARAIAVRPRLLLLDEPMAALDAKLRASVQREIRQLQTHLGITTLLVTHDQTEAMSMSDRIAVMNHGKIEQLADPLTLYRQPRTPFVAEFVGEINRIHGSLVEQDGKWALCPDGSTENTLPLETLPGNLKPGNQATLMLRPEALHIRTGGGEGRAATVEDTVLIGDRVSVYLDLAGLKLRAVRLSNEFGSERNLARGDTVSVSWNAREPLLFSGHV